MRKLFPRAATPWQWMLDLGFAAASFGVTLLLFFVLARLIKPDTHLFFIWANAYTFWIYLPAYPVAVAAAVFRRWLPLGMASVVVAAHLWWVIPDYTRGAQSIPAEAGNAPTLRLMTANVFFGNEDFSGLAAEVMEVDPDVLFLQEFGERMEGELVAAGANQRFPYRQYIAENPYFGSAIYSKLPLEDVVVIQAGGRPLVRARVEVGGEPVLIYNVHATSPGFGANVADDWNDGWKLITTEFGAVSLPLIAAGDFNMDQHHKWYGKLKDESLGNCHEERGRGSATSWPQGRKLRQIRIDQVFHSAGVVCLSIREGRGEGSDHKPLIAELAILPGD